MAPDGDRQLLEKDQLATLLQTLSPKLIPIRHVVPPNETGRPAHPRNAIYIVVKIVVAVRDDRKILIIETDVGNTAGASGALES